MATYKEIQEYVRSRHGYTVKNCWIAHVKEMVGLPLRKAPNRHDRTDRMVPCRPEKVQPIQEAFKHFGMI